VTTSSSPLIPLENLSAPRPRPGANAGNALLPNAQPRLPSWLKVKTGKRELTRATGEKLKELGIVTVCQEAACPNIGECWSHSTATFMIGGDKCTRNCGFCNVHTHRPDALDATEPQRVAAAAARLKLKYVVITSVDRDDLPDGGAAHWVQTIEAVRAALPDARIEVLTPDFKGSTEQINLVASTRPDVYNHNIETVPRLYRTVRPGSKYERSLQLLQYVKRQYPQLKTKSGLMTGLGETREEIIGVLHDLKAHGVDFVTIGQYLRPTPRHLPVQKYWHPDEFAELKKIGEEIGFAMVASGPFVRSSYHAGEDYERAAG
jgi:lipoic acid synthetase